MKLTTSILLLLLVVDLTAQPLYSCPGDTLVINGAMFTEPGQYNVLFTGSQGQDSIVSIELRHHPDYQVWELVEICMGDSVSGLGIVYRDTVLQTIYKTIHGCDSIYVLEINVVEVAGLAIVGDTHLCEEETTQLVVGFYEDFAWSTGESSRLIDIATAGTYAVTVSNALGCRDSVSVEVTSSKADVALEITDVACNGLSSGEVLITQYTSNYPPLSFALDGDTFDEMVSNLPAGDYDLMWLDQRDCQWIESVEVLEPPQALELDVEVEPQTYYEGDDIELSLLSNHNLAFIEWLAPSTATSMSETLEIVAQEGEITAIVEDNNGCQDTVTTNLSPILRSNLVYPNAFSPNGDGNNDVFRLGADDLLDVIHNVTISDRWGGIVYQCQETTDLAEIQWDGMLRGQAVSQGAYVLRIYYTYNNQYQSITDMITIF
jgi:gliding motility-associated-like protein